MVTDDRVEEVRAAREQLTDVVPALTGEAERLTAALELVWTEEAPTDERAALAEALRVEPFTAAVDELAAVSLVGDGPDVTAATALLADMVVDGRAMLAAVETELASLVGVPPFDARLEGLPGGWDARGSYSQQLAAFDGLAAEADELADVAAGRDAVPTCVELWPRRSAAAATVAARTRELRALVRDRRGQAFDELRDAYRQDPYGAGAPLGVLDARAAQRCWSTASDVPPLLATLEEHVAALAAALDPPDLQG